MALVKAVCEARGGTGVEGSCLGMCAVAIAFPVFFLFFTFIVLLQEDAPGCSL